MHPSAPRSELASSAAAAWLLAATCWCAPSPGQQSTPPSATVLVYELAVTELQDALRTLPDSSIEALVAASVDCVATRLGETAEVRRDGVSSFRVRIAAAAAEQLAAVRRQVERRGLLSLHLLATAGGGEVELQLEQERQRLEQWLADGGRDALGKDADAIKQFEPIDAKRIAWVVRRPDPAQKAGNYLLSRNRASREATVPTFTEQQWQQRGQPAGGDAPPPCLLELVALDMHARSITGADLDRQRTRIMKGRMTAQCLLTIRESEQQSYRAWLTQHSGRAVGAVIDGELIAVVPVDPRHGDGLAINGHFDDRQLELLRIAAQCGSLPVLPRLVSQESVAAEGPGENKGR